ncbi:MAG: hypothetical protein IAI49_11850, partial [Candidatus Eremiobacteraeota bacterium]|nr:hypothetical protein [Candidatus Eremiobacteraeota bacterium]
ALGAYLDDPAFAAGAATTGFIAERAALYPPVVAVPPRIAALGAALRYVLAAEGGAFGAWTAWSTSRLPSSTVVLSFGDDDVRRLTVTAHSARRMNVAAGDDSFDVAFESLDAARGRARYREGDGPWSRIAFAQAGVRTFFTFEGGSFAAVDRGSEPAASAASLAAGDGFVRAPMSGRIVSIAGRAGDVLLAGTPLVILEAMKMEHAMTLPLDVTLCEVTATAGVQVHPGDILLSYEPAPAAS